MNRVLLFAQAGCPACSEFLPRARRASFVTRVPVFPIDTRSPRGEALANRFGIEATPTMVVVRSDGRALGRKVGGIPDAELYGLLAAAKRSR